ncbi:hypothetical protein LXA43DRAFT_847956, partial [Ganoderma leucocontextum]
ALTECLVRLLSRVFPRDAPPERIVIFHDDLSSQNIFVDASGTLTGLINWKCVSALPLWRACARCPGSSLGDTAPTQRPNPETYGRADSDEGGRPANALYFEHLLELWEQTQLRAVFLDEMERPQPQWVGVNRAGVLRNAFYTAMMHCDDELRFRRRMRQWVDGVRRG